MSGILMYDPCIGAYDPQDDMWTLDFIRQNNNILNFNDSFIADLEALDESCGFRQFKEEYMKFPPAGVQPPLEANDGKCATWNAAYLAAYVRTSALRDSKPDTQPFQQAQNPCFNVYLPSLVTCPLLSDPLGYPTDLQLSYPGLPVYFNRTDVKKAMHAPMDVEWLECAPHDVFKKGVDSSLDPIQYVLPKILEATSRVLV
jgi:carboxypeptidase D